MQPTNLDCVQNLYEWRVYGWRRSGNHAIVFMGNRWISWVYGIEISRYYIKEYTN